MTLIAVSIAVHLVNEIEDALARAIVAAAKGASLVEWRVDHLAQEVGGADAVINLVRRSPLPCIVTCRPEWEGGEYRGDEQTRLELFEAVLKADQRPRYIDVELTAVRDPEFRRRIHEGLAHHGPPAALSTSLILSSHDFQARPRDLMQRVEAMTNDPDCAVIKLAWHARSLRDNLEAFDLLLERQKPMIALCMGPFGLPSRVLAAKFGGLLTFATDQEGLITGPGQPTIEELTKLYRLARIGEHTRVYGVIGWPVEHSLGPAIHNAGFEAVGHDGVYLPLPIPPEYEHFKATVGALLDHPALNFRGASVTIPHKENLLRFVAESGGRVDELAERIGAANTLNAGSAGGMECMNTDAPAAVDSLCAAMGIERTELATRRIALLGAGGVARAVLAGLIDIGASVAVFNRNAERAQRLVEEFAQREAASGRNANVSAAGDLEAIAGQRFDVIINCTPVGMAGGSAADESPLPADVMLDDQVTVFDTVYTPARTPLIKEAESRGARVVTGVDMFIRQAAIQFERWTGVPAPIETFRFVVERSGRRA